MYISVTLKRYRTVKEVGEIVMNVRIIVYYQLMRVCQVILHSLLMYFFFHFYFPVLIFDYC